MILLVRPLSTPGFIAPDAALPIHALSGYSGGGRAMIERWEDPQRGLSKLPYEAPYSIDQAAQAYSRDYAPRRAGNRAAILYPMSARFAAACASRSCCRKIYWRNPPCGKAIWETLAARYENEPSSRSSRSPTHSAADETSFDPQVHNDTNRISLSVLPHQSGHVLLMARSTISAKARPASRFRTSI